MREKINYSRKRFYSGKSIACSTFLHNKRYIVAKIALEFLYRFKICLFFETKAALPLLRNAAYIILSLTNQKSRGIINSNKVAKIINLLTVINPNAQA
ncbi:hypothetical protein ACRPOS_007440 [Bartonella heixiaziensis]|uniref:hypothetical protein n=1 Tax=Bartonella heixiaziensis TaxID=1461000 RepID=UPI0039088A9F